MSDSVGASLPGAAPSEAAITAFLDAHRRVMDTDYESSDLPRVAVRAGLRAAYAVDRGAALEAGPEEIITIDEQGRVIAPRKSTVLLDPEPECTGRGEHDTQEERPSQSTPPASNSGAAANPPSAGPSPREPAILPDTFIERAVQIAIAHEEYRLERGDTVVGLTVFESAFIRQKYAERNAGVRGESLPRDAKIAPQGQSATRGVSGNVGGVGGEEP